MTKGKMILELLKYAKSAMKNFDQSEASIVVMWHVNSEHWTLMIY